MARPTRQLTHMKIITCPYCKRSAALVTGDKVYPHRPDLFDKWFWLCEPCGAWVGCHPRTNRKGHVGLEDGMQPLGRLANAQLRRAKQAAHAAFDPIWKSGEMSRASAYKWLSVAIGISRQNCHIGMMDVDACNAVVEAVKIRTNQDKAA